MFLHALVQAFAFAAEDKRGGGVVSDLIVDSGGAFVEAVDPEPGSLELFERLSHVDDASDGKIFECAGGSFGDGFSERRRAALGNDNGCSSGSMRGADDGSEIVRIFDAIEEDEQLRARDHLSELDVAVNGAQSDYALMRRAVAGAIKRLVRLKADRDGFGAAEVDDFLNARSAGALRDEDSIERAAGA